MCGEQRRKGSRSGSGSRLRKSRTVGWPLRWLPSVPGCVTSSRAALRTHQRSSQGGHSLCCRPPRRFLAAVPAFMFTEPLCVVAISSAKLYACLISCRLRPDRRSLRDKLLESWGGKSYYARLQEMSQEEESQDKDGQAATGAVQPARQQVLQQALQPAGPQPSGTPAAKAAVSRTAASLASPAPQRGGVQPSRFTPAAKASRPRVQVPATAGSSTAASKAGLPTPNSQRRKLNELTQSLQLLKVTTRHRQAIAAEAAAASSAAGRSGPPAVAASKVRGRVSSPLPLQEAAPAAPGAAASRSRRARSTTPEAELQLGGEQAPQAAGSSAQVSPQGVAPRTASRRSARRGGSSSPTEASATASQDKAVGAAAAAAATSTAPSADCPEAMHAELAAARQLLAAVQADNARLAGQLRSAAQEAADERAARVAAEQQAEQLAADLAASAKDRQVCAVQHPVCFLAVRGVIRAVLCVQRHWCRVLMMPGLTAAPAAGPRNACRTSLPLSLPRSSAAASWPRSFLRRIKGRGLPLPLPLTGPVRWRPGGQRQARRCRQS